MRGNSSAPSPGPAVRSPPTPKDPLPFVLSLSKDPSPQLRTGPGTRLRTPPVRCVHPPVRCVHAPFVLSLSKENGDAAQDTPRSLRTPPARCVHAPFVLSLSKDPSPRLRTGPGTRLRTRPSSASGRTDIGEDGPFEFPQDDRTEGEPAQCGLSAGEGERGVSTGPRPEDQRAWWTVGA